MKKPQQDDASDDIQGDPLKSTSVGGKKDSAKTRKTKQPAKKKKTSKSGKATSRTKATKDTKTPSPANVTAEAVDTATNVPTTYVEAVEVIDPATTIEPDEVADSSHDMHLVSYEETPEATVIDVEPAEPSKPISLYPSHTFEIKVHVPDIPALTKLRQSRGVTLVVNTPTVIMLNEHLRSIPRRRLWLNFAVCLTVIVLLGNTHFFSHPPKATGAVSEQPQIQRGSPTFPTVLPAGKAISTLGGWARISPPGRNPVYTYIDKIKGIQINVSEQPLPASFKADQDDQISQLARNFDATQKITAGTTTAYVGTSAKGPQSVIFAKSKLLILIKSASPIDNKDWAAYINSLQ